MAEWTPRETATMLQNLHLSPNLISAVIPGRSLKSIRNKRDAMRKKNPVSYCRKTWDRVYGSLIRRGWSPLHANMYIKTYMGNEEARISLEMCGLWNMKG